MYLILTILLLFSTAFAQEKEKHKSAIVLAEGQVHEGDFFAVADSVEISGTVKGDAYILASQIFIDGTILGDVLGCGGSVEIAGHVQHNVRVLAGQLMITGTVGNNATLIAGNIQSSPSGNIVNNGVLIAGNVDFGSNLGNNLTLLASNFRLVGQVFGNLNAYVGYMRLTSRSKIGGVLDYSSNAEAWIDPGAKIEGKVAHHPSFIQDVFKGSFLHVILMGSRLAALLMNFLYSFFIGFLLIRFFPHNLRKVLATLSHKPIRCFGVGILILAFLPLLSLLLLMTILGVPFALTLIALNVIAFYTAKTYSILWVSNHLFAKINFKPNRLAPFALGLIVYFAITSIPYAGSFIAVVSMLFGIGASILAQSPKKLFS